MPPTKKKLKNTLLGGGFRYFVISSLFGEDSNLTNIFLRG